MTAGHIAELYSDYLDGTLAAAERERVEEHLRSCAQCAAELDALRELTTDLRELPQMPLPAGFSVGVRERLRVTRPTPLFGWRNPGFSGAIAALLLLGVFIAIKHRPTTETAQLFPKAKSAAISPQASNSSGLNSVLNLPDIHTDELPLTATSKLKIEGTTAKDFHHKGDGSAISATIIAALPSAISDKDVSVVNNEPPRQYAVTTPMATLLSENNNYPLTYPAPENTELSVWGGNVTLSGRPMEDAVSTGMSNSNPTGGYSAPGTIKSASPAGYMPWASGPTPTAMPSSTGTQKLTKGTLIAKIQADAEPGNNIMLQLNGVYGGTFDASIIGADGKAKNVDARKIKLSGTPTQNIILNVAEENEASTIRFAINSELKTNNFYLFVPGKGRQNASPTRMTPYATDTSMANTLAQLAQDSGMYVLCPADFVEDDSKGTRIPAADINAVKTFATQRRYRIDKTAQFYNVSPVGE